MDNVKIGKKQAVALIVTIIINNIVISSSEVLVTQVGSSGILNSIYISIIAIIGVFLICKLFKNFQGQDILDISDYLGGKFLRCFVGLCFFIYFLLTTTILLLNFSNCMQVLYYPLTHILFIIILFIITALIISTLRSNGIFRCNLMILPISIISLVLVFLGNFKNFEITNIFPIFGNGLKATFFSGLSNLYAFSGIAYLYFIPPHLRETEDFKKISITSVVMSSLLLILSISIIVLKFDSFVSTNELFPIYIAVRYIEFGTFFQRLDSVFLLIWIMSFACYFGISTSFCIHIFKKITNISDSKPIAFPFLLTILGLCTMPITAPIINFLEGTFLKSAFFIVVVALAFIILVSANIKKRILT